VAPVPAMPRDDACHRVRSQRGGGLQEVPRLARATAGGCDGMWKMTASVAQRSRGRASDPVIGDAQRRPLERAAPFFVVLATMVANELLGFLALGPRGTASGRVSRKAAASA
jgi:hypothetical protein